jgi:hypothetical protein
MPINRTPDTYHLAGIKRGTATSNFHVQRDNLLPQSGALAAWAGPAIASPAPALVTVARTTRRLAAPTVNLARVRVTSTTLPRAVPFAVWRPGDGSGASAGVASVARVRRNMGHLVSKDGVHPKVRQHFQVARERRRARIDDSIPAGLGVIPTAREGAVLPRHPSPSVWRIPDAIDRARISVRLE